MKDSFTINNWSSLIHQLINYTPGRIKSNKVEYHFNHFTWTHPGPIDDFDITKIYPGIKGKMSSLKSSYFNKDSIKRAKYRMDNKIGTSWSISLQNNDKNYTEQDHCMVSMVIFKEPKNHYEITVFYRTTEICRKFLFDLVFLRDQVIPKLGIKDYNITFMFTRLTLSYIFLHTLFLMDKHYYPEGESMIFGGEFWGGYLDYINRMLPIEERGSMLRSHWRHFQTFKNTDTFRKVYETLKSNYDEGTD